MNADAAGLQAILAFYVESGVDAVLQEEPADRLTGDDLPAAGAVTVAAAAERTPVARVTPMSAPAIGPPAAGAPAPPRRMTALPQSPADTAAPADAVMAARELARNAASLEELRNLLDAFEGCGLRKTAKQLVFAAGNPQARVMFVGEAPGREEDLEGVAFVGRSGQLLDRMLTPIGLDRTTAYIANVIPWRPPGNRTPTPQETEVCLPFTLRQIELANPDILVCLGRSLGADAARHQGGHPPVARALARLPHRLA